MTNGTLALRNEAQRVLWTDELLGQLSDGRWENSRPWNHWECWHDAAVVVDPDNVGRDFYAPRDGYCFNEKWVMEIIGERMLDMVRAIQPDYTEKDLVRDLRDIRKIIKVRRVVA